MDREKQREEKEKKKEKYKELAGQALVNGESIENFKKTVEREERWRSDGNASGSD